MKTMKPATAKMQHTEHTYSIRYVQVAYDNRYFVFFKNGREFCKIPCTHTDEAKALFLGLDDSWTQMSALSGWLNFIECVKRQDEIWDRDEEYT